MKTVHVVVLCLSVVVVTLSMSSAVDQTLESKNKQELTILPKWNPGMNNGRRPNLVGSTNNTSKPVEAEQVIVLAEKEVTAELPPYRIEKLHKVMIDGPGKFSIITEHETGILAHELLYVDDRGTREAYLHHYIAENSKTDFIQERRTINVRMINDAKKGKMWGEIKKFQPQHFHVELHVNMEQDPIE